MLMAGAAAGETSPGPEQITAALPEAMQAWPAPEANLAALYPRLRRAGGLRTPTLTLTRNGAAQLA